MLPTVSRCRGVLFYFSLHVRQAFRQLKLGGQAITLPSPRVFFASVFTISAHYYLGAWKRLFSFTLNALRQCLLNTVIPHFFEMKPKVTVFVYVVAIFQLLNLYFNV